MKHILPVLSLILSVFVFVCGALCLILFSLVASIGAPVAVSAFAVPCLIVSVMLDALSLGMNFLLLKHKVCLAGLIISLVAAAEIVASFIILFTF